MRRAGLIFLMIAGATMDCLSQSIPWELLTPEVVSLGRMPMKANAFAYETIDLAKAKDKRSSRYFLDLNGDWKFHWVQNPKERSGDFYRTDFDDQAWGFIKVPANWELNGYGIPIYVNQPYEFIGHAKRYGALNPPFDIPEDNNPVGSYRKKFVIPGSWDGRQVFIHLGAVKSAFFIWVNGQKVGYSEDSKLAAEFDITEFITPGENLVALQVYRWSDASYLECQDMWRISGIERDVFIYSTPKLDIRDFKITSVLDSAYERGVLHAELEINNYKIDKGALHSKPDTFSVEMELRDAAGNAVWKEKSGKTLSVLGSYHTSVSFNASIPNVSKWTAESPYLYDLFMTLRDKDSAVLQVVPVKAGFRTVELKDRKLLVNGRKVLLKGVNRHEHNARTGHAITREDMRKDMEMMKKLNVNAVRNSHYPPDPYWLELCDEYGLYVVDEANIESHGRGYDLEFALANDKQWRNAHLDRIQRMYERDKNHPSVIAWSLGNEAGNGAAMYEAYDWLKETDIRPVQYERAEQDYNTDLYVPQYPSPAGLIDHAKSNPDRVMIMSEYAHIMGNSLGNFKEYWDAIENHPFLQGGFIWEWLDQAIDTVKNGKRIMAYGGDFPLHGPVDKNLSDNNFCVKGVVTAYREMTPMAVEVKKVYQHIKTALSENFRLVVTNGYAFRNLDNIQLSWELLENGLEKESGTVKALSVEAGEHMEIAIPVKSKRLEGRSYFLNVYYSLKEAEPFMESGHVVAYDQFELNKPIPTVVNTSKGALKLTRNGDACKLTGQDFVIDFDMKNGVLKSYTYKGQTLFENGPLPSFWRAPTDNDIGAGFNKSMRMWRNAYQEGRTIEAEAHAVNGSQIEVAFSRELASGDAIAKQKLTIYGNGSIRVDNAFQAIKGDHKLMMRIGNDLEANKQLDKVNWFGCGPGESYWDRKTGSLVGRYSQGLEEQYFPYARPQESGAKSDVRWYSLTNRRGEGFRVEFIDSLLSCSALPYSLNDLDPERDKKQYHSGELETRDKIFMHIDLQQTGLQGIDSWGAWPLKTYQIPFEDSGYSYWIRPLK